MPSLPKQARGKAAQTNLVIDGVNPCFVKWGVLNIIWVPVMGADGFMGIPSTAFLINNGGQCGEQGRRSLGPVLGGR